MNVPKPNKEARVAQTQVRPVSRPFGRVVSRQITERQIYQLVHGLVEVSYNEARAHVKGNLCDHCKAKAIELGFDVK